MSQEKDYEKMFGQFVDYQKALHEQNQNRIRVGLKVNILLPLVFLIISFLTEGSKLVFLILWIVSLFGISFYLLYVEYTDFKIQEKLKEVGAVDEEEQNALVGKEVIQRIDGLEDFSDFEFFSDIKELKSGIESDIKELKGKREERRKPDQKNAVVVQDLDEGDEEDE